MAKTLTEYDRVAGYLDTLFARVNEKYFENTLSKAVITLQSTPMAYGHFTCGKVWKMGDTERYEINLDTGTVSRPIEHVVATLIHEMVHYYCLVNGIKDTSRGGTYHNKRFKVEAEKRGLRIECYKQYGWTITHPTDDLIEWCADMDFRDIQISRIGFSSSSLGGGSVSKGRIGKTSGGGSSTRKYQCPCCGNSFRATKNLSGMVRCIPCDVDFEEV